MYKPMVLPYSRGPQKGDETSGYMPNSSIHHANCCVKGAPQTYYQPASSPLRLDIVALMQQEVYKAHVGTDDIVPTPPAIMQMLCEGGTSRLEPAWSRSVLSCATRCCSVTSCTSLAACATSAALALSDSACRSFAVASWRAYSM